MKCWFFVFSIVSLLSFAANAQSANPAPCQLLEVASLPMTPISDNRFTIPMTVAGRNLNMLLDTDDDLSMLTGQVAVAMGLTINQSIHPYGTLYITPGGLTVTDFTHASDIQLGNIKGEGKFLFGIRPEATSPGYDGSLGVSFLRDYDVDLDFGNRKFNLFAKGHCPGSVVYWTKGPVAVVPGKLTGNGQTVVLYFEVQVDGQTVDAVLDASAPRSYMDWNRSKFMFNIDEKSPGVTALPAGGGADRFMYKYPFKTLSLGAVTVNNPDIEMLPPEVSAISQFFSSKPWIVIGADVLHQLHIYVANGENKLYVTPASAH